jgi:hypothetical protein
VLAVALTPQFDIAMQQRFVAGVEQSSGKSGACLVLDASVDVVA